MEPQDQVVEQHYSMSCRFLRPELAELHAGGRIVRNLVRDDGLKHRHITLAFLFLNDDHESSSSFNSLLAVRCFDVCCKCRLNIRVRVQILLQDSLVRQLPWLEEIEISDDSNAVKFNGLLRMGDFEGTPSNTIVTVKVFVDLRKAAPAFLLPPTMASPATSGDLCEETVTLRCSDTSLLAPKILLQTESSVWEAMLKVDSENLNCEEFTASQMQPFLYFLHLRDFYDIARFDTFHNFVKISSRFAVNSVSRRCALFVNECLLLDHSSQPKPAGSSSQTVASTQQSTVCSKVRWGISDLIALWDSTLNYLKEECLAKSLMRIICQSPYSEIVDQPTFASLSVESKSQFYHHYLTEKDDASTRTASSGF